MEANQVIQGRCEDVMATLPDNSIDLICTDPPYFKVKNQGDDAFNWWDHQWDKPEGFLDWIDQLAEQWARVLKPNGSLYCFASPRMAARVEVKLGERFNVVNHIVWIQPDGSGAEKGARGGLTQSFIDQTERIIFAEPTFNGTTAMAERIKAARIKAGIPSQKISAIARGKETGLCWLWEHPEKPGGCVPTCEDYVKVMQALEAREEDSLRREYEELRRPFSVSADVPYTDVWTYPTVQSYPGKHPCEKPLEMLEHIITASSRPGAVVLDCFAGSGNTLVAAKQLGRQYIGIDIDPHWVDVTRGKLGQTQSFVSTEDRLQWLETQVAAQGAKLRKIEEKQQLSLFDEKGAAGA